MNIKVRIYTWVLSAFVGSSIGFAWHIYSKYPPRVAQSSAKHTLIAMSDMPECIHINAVSRPDSVFDRKYVTDEECMKLGKLMMNLNQSLINETDAMDISNPAFSRKMSHQISLMTELRDIIGFPSDTVINNRFTGWKVKIDYNDTSKENGMQHGERWFILDPSGKYVIRSFEIPIL